MNPQRHIKNLSLIGFMGVGKTTVGHALASLLHFQMVDTDDLVERRSGKRISDIFSQEGEAKFREYERQVVEDLAALERTVISTGGGLAVNPANLVSLKSHSMVVCLWASPETIWERVRHQNHRPLLRDPDPLGKIRKLIAEREPFYRNADILVNTEQRSMKEVAHQVFYQFRSVHPMEQSSEGMDSNKSG